MPFIGAAAFAKYENDPVFFKQLPANSKGFIIDVDVFGSFTGAINREHIQRSQYFSIKWFLENITSCKRIDRVFKKISNYGGVEKRVGMIAGKDKRPLAF